LKEARILFERNNCLLCKHIFLHAFPSLVQQEDQHCKGKVEKQIQLELCKLKMSVLSQWRLREQELDRNSAGLWGITYPNCIIKATLNQCLETSNDPEFKQFSCNIQEIGIARSVFTCKINGIFSVLSKQYRQSNQIVNHDSTKFKL
jgi:hypothetical protein